MNRGGLHRATARSGLCLVAILGGGSVLAACGNGGVSLARQACAHVDRSIALLDQSARTANPTRSSSLNQQAYVELRQALPLAALAASQNGQWQALMTTISESNRVPEHDLLTALTAQCAVANSSNPGLPPPPSSVPPPATGPSGS